MPTCIAPSLDADEDGELAEGITPPQADRARAPANVAAARKAEKGANTRFIPKDLCPSLVDIAVRNSLKLVFPAA